MFSWWIMLGLFLLFFGRGLVDGTQEYLKEEKARKPRMKDEEKLALAIVALVIQFVAYIIMTFGVGILFNQI